MGKVFCRFQARALPEVLWAGKASSYRVFIPIAVKSSHCPRRGRRCNINFLATRWLPASLGDNALSRVSSHSDSGAGSDWVLKVRRGSVIFHPGSQSQSLAQQLFFSIIQMEPYLTGCSCALPSVG